MSIEQITPKQAKDLLDRDPEAVYLDVRSIPEFNAGHPVKSINIPLLHVQSGQMIPNPDFQKKVLETLAQDKKIVVGCKAGGRSQRACEIMEALGYTQLSNMLGGFSGGVHPETGDFVEGWEDQGLPVQKS